MHEPSGIANPIIGPAIASAPGQPKRVSALPSTAGTGCCDEVHDDGFTVCFFGRWRLDVRARTLLDCGRMSVSRTSWFEFLAARPALGEVNFWRPGDLREFRSLAPGEPFFFKSHHPHNRVVGGGLFSGFAPLRVSEACELFGLGNGVDSLDGMRRLVGRYRKRPIQPSEDPTIGRVFIRDTLSFAATNRPSRRRG